MGKGRKHIAGLALLMLTVAIRAQLISVQSTLSSDSMMIGDQLFYTLQVDAADHVRFLLPVLSDTLSRNIEVLSPPFADTSYANGRVTVEHRYVITGFETGLQIVPSQPVVYDFNDRTDTARSMPLLLSVFEPEVDTSQQIRPIKPPINTPVTLREALPWIALGAGIWLAGTLVMALVWMYRQRRKDPEIFSIKPLEPAHVEAFRELDRLKEEKLWESGRVKQFYTRLTWITRHYIERQYGIPAMERTTHEILEAFRRSNLEDPILDEMLKELLELADLVKFAKQDPLPLENQTHLNNAYLFVQKTYPLFFVEKQAEEKESEESGGVPEETDSEEAVTEIQQGKEGSDG